MYVKNCFSELDQLVARWCGCCLFKTHNNYINSGKKIIQLLVCRGYFVGFSFALQVAAGVWIYALGLSLPPLFGWGSYGPEAGNISCSVSWEVHDPETMSGSYITFLMTFGLILPVIVITASYFAIILTLKKVKKRAGKNSTTTQIIFRHLNYNWSYKKK